MASLLSPFFLLLPLLLLPSLAASHAGLSSKRGLALISSTSESDISFLTANNSPIAWYYTWSPYAHSAVSSSDAVFLPLLHGVDAAEDEELTAILGRAPDSSTHLLTFNEPDHIEGDGGSDISPKDAAKAYIEHIVPLRNGSTSDGRTWNISHPSVTGSGQGLDWLREFNESCWDIDSRNGCPTDFIAVHYYGDFPGLAGWLGTLREFYGNMSRRGGDDDDDDDDDDDADDDDNENNVPPFWITEMAFAGEDDEANVAMLNESMKYLDDQDWVEGYAWFGAFRSDGANEWTGDGVSMLNDDGGLTELGAEYLGGEDNGFEEGMNGGAGVKPDWTLITALGIVALSGVGCAAM
ncbi:glycosyl hydrolase catalytic core domain-containing protein [Sarocladium implicatum]|nr:glycosyl hydrolase catalytic core domain-containing protein [Sarocladium implicatum]